MASSTWGTITGYGRWHEEGKSKKNSREVIVGCPQTEFKDQIVYSVHLFSFHIAARSLFEDCVCVESTNSVIFYDRRDIFSKILISCGAACWETARETIGVFEVCSVFSFH